VKLKPVPIGLLAPPPPKGLFPVGCPVLVAPKRLLPEGLGDPKRAGVDEALVGGVAPKLNLGGSLAIASVCKEDYSPQNTCRLIRPDCSWSLAGEIAMWRCAEW